MNIVLTSAPTTTDLLVALNEGKATVHSERTNGTFRRRHFLADGTNDRAVAEWVRLQRTGQEADGEAPAVTPRSMASIAKEMHISVAAVRRILIDLAVTEELEDTDQDELEAMWVGSTEVTN
jgi:hypothetical protein